MLAYLPKSLWLVGLGHLGQAYAWTLGMLPYPADGRPHLVLQDFDKATKSNLSTCLLLWAADLNKHKVSAVASCLEAAGFTTALVERRFGAGHRVMVDEPTTALFGVCGMTLLASRAVATPFVGALAAVLASAEVMRPFHGGLVYASLDVQMKSLRHRTGAAPASYQGLQTPFVQAEKRSTGTAPETT